jgi:superfamily II DNA/RNA helicase
MRALEMLKKFLKAKPEVVSALIFVNDPHRVEIIYEKLLEMGFIAAPLHGESSKDDRKVGINNYILVLILVLVLDVLLCMYKCFF